MKVALINGSPKFKDSTSGALLSITKQYLQDTETEEFICNKTQLEQEQIESILHSDAILFSFPLYIDSIPSQLLRCLVQMQKYIEQNPLDKKPMVYAIVNNGFIDGKQDHLAIDNIKHWSHRCGLTFGQGVGVGGGGMLSYLISVPNEAGPKRSISLAIKTVCDNMKERASGDTLAVEPKYPKWLYRLQAELGWRQLAKGNGLKTKDLYLQR